MSNLDQEHPHDRLLKELFSLSRLDESDYIKLSGWCSLSVPIVEQLTGKAALVFSDDFENASEWLPKSQMRVDSEGSLYLASWLFRKVSTIDV